MSSDGRDLTSFRSASPPAPPTEPDSARAERRRYIPDATDLVYHALRAEKNINTAIPAIFSESVAIDNARFAGEGASFAVYRRRIPLQRKIEAPINSGDGWTSSFSDDRKMPEVIAYKVPRIEFTNEGRPTDATKHAMLATVMELFLTSQSSLLRHKNVVDFLGLAWSTNPYSVTHKTPVLIVEYSELGSLAHVLRQQYLPLTTRRRLCLDICNGLQALHDCNLLHGDLKGENVLLFPDTQNGFVAKLSDFGYSYVLEHNQPEFSIGGTRPWRAPETNGRVLRGTARATDVYSLSLLIWCTLAHGVNVFELIVPETSSREDFHQTVAAMKVMDAVAPNLTPSEWYPQVLKILADRRGALEPTKAMHLLAALKDRMTTLSNDLDVWVGMEKVEELVVVILSTFPAFHSSIIQLLADTGPVPPHVTTALADGLSVDPAKRDLDAIVQSLGGSKSGSPSEGAISEAPFRHRFQWSDWPKLEPWLQGYVSTLIQQRAEADKQKSLINPPEALLLAILYTNGYGLERDEVKALEWIRGASRADLQMADAYSYRFITGLGYQIDDPRTAAPTLESVALRGSRTALEDLRTIWPENFDKAREFLRYNLAGVGSNFFFLREMLWGRNLESWHLILKDVEKGLPFLEKNEGLVGTPINKRGDRILHLAASCGHTEAIEGILNRFSSSLAVNQLNDQGETPLLCACRAGQLKTALWLLGHDADASIAARNGESPLHWMVSFDEAEAAQLCLPLFQAGAEVKAKTEVTISYHVFQSGFVLDRFSPGYPVGWASLCDRPDIVQILLDRTEDPTLCAHSWPGVNSALQIAASQHRAEALKMMIDSIAAFNVKHGRDGYASFAITSLLQQAVGNGDLFNMILFNGANWKKRLHATLKILIPLSNLAFPVHGYDGHGANLLYWSVSLARDEVVDYLLEEAWNDMRGGLHFDEQKILSSDVGAFRPSDVNKACGPRTPLLEAVRWNRTSMIRKLLAHGASATICGRNPFNGESSTWTAMHVLAQAGHDKSELPKLLQDEGVSIDRRDQDEQSIESPLLLAIQNDCFRLAENLLALGADPSLTSLSCALLTLRYPTSILGHLVATNSRSSTARIRFLLTSEPFASTVSHIVEPERQWTALHRATAGHLDVSFRNTDIDNGAKLQYTDVDWSANSEIMRELILRFGKYVDAVEEGAGNTALHIAIEAGNAGAARLLVDRGARLDILNADGENAQMLAVRLSASCLSVTEVDAASESELIARRECAELLSSAGR